jgi:hypothetical protein
MLKSLRLGIVAAAALPGVPWWVAVPCDVLAGAAPCPGRHSVFITGVVLWKQGAGRLT